MAGAGQKGRELGLGLVAEEELDSRSNPVEH